MAEPAKLVTELTTDALSSVLVRLTLAHEIAAVAPTCRAFNLAVRHAIAARRFTGEVVTLAGHRQAVMCVAAAPDGRAALSFSSFSRMSSSETPLPGEAPGMRSDALRM